jgi:hypothetical protein
VKLNLKSSVFLTTWFPELRYAKCISGDQVMKDHNYTGAKSYESAVHIYFFQSWVYILMYLFY